MKAHVIEYHLDFTKEELVMGLALSVTKIWVMCYYTE